MSFILTLLDNHTAKITIDKNSEVRYTLSKRPDNKYKIWLNDEEIESKKFETIGEAIGHVFDLLLEK